MTGQISVRPSNDCKALISNTKALPQLLWENIRRAAEARRHTGLLRSARRGLEMTAPPKNNGKAVAEHDDDRHREWRPHAPPDEGEGGLLRDRQRPAVKVMRILTGEETEKLPPDDGKNKAATSWVEAGAARAEKMAPERRAEIARTRSASEKVEQIEAGSACTVRTTNEDEKISRSSHVKTRIFSRPTRDRRPLTALRNHAR